MLEVTHIEHSGFCLEMEKRVLIFDWYRGKLPLLKKDKPVYVFVSHSHGDHYGPCIWKLRKQFSKVQYYLDDTIRLSDKKEDTVFISPENHYEQDGMAIDTFVSNDEGSAFLVQADGYRIYHAGDLNLWLWDDNTPDEDKYMKDVYSSQMKRLKECLHGEKLDVAMVPLDPRLEKTAPEGLAYFMEHIGARYVFPMHYFGRKKEAEEEAKGKKLASYQEFFHFEDSFQLP